MLEIVGLTGGWGPTTIVERLDLSVAPGETVAVVGRNGVGKTTLLELIAGRAQLRSGEIRARGRDICRLPIHQRARAGIGYVPQQREVFRSLTVKEHLAIAARPAPIASWPAIGSTDRSRTAPASPSRPQTTFRQSYIP